MWAPLTLCLLSALLATGSALRCEVCQSQGKSCSGPLLPCAPSEGTCVKGVTEFKLGNDSFFYMGKSCLEPENCKTGNFTVTYGKNISRRVNIFCCGKDGCNSGSILVPAVSLVPNGRQCPSCFVEGTEQCKNKKPLLCTGAENQCVDLTGTLIMGNTVLSRVAAGCGVYYNNVMKPGVKKYAQFVVTVLTEFKLYPAPMAGGDAKKP